MTTPPTTILFTAFEPSADDHAAAVIAKLRAGYPDINIAAWGGPKMEKAGATLVERTGDDAVMGVPGWQKIIEHRRINQRVASWLDDNPVTVHVPVDSPAANFPLCEITKPRGIKVVHLVAPQIWAWGKWRVSKLRRLTDLVLCFLPFEEGWFTTRGVPARFIGHPLFCETLDLSALDAQLQDAPAGKIKLGIMPGSRPGELTKNFPTILDAFRRLRAQQPRVVGLIAARDASTDARLRKIADDAGGWPAHLHSMVGAADAVIRWSDLALVVSGTITLQIARQRRPMVVVYKENLLLWNCLGRWLVATRDFALPNVIAGRRVVPEFIPHFGGPEPICEAIAALLEQPERMEAQREQLAEICERFKGRDAAGEAARAIASAAGA